MVIHRKSRKRFEVEAQARFLTFSCFDRLPLFSNDRIKDHFALHLARARARHGFRLQAWVVMPEHVHLLLVPDLSIANVPHILKSLKWSFARSVLARWRAIDAPILKRLSESPGDERFWLRGGGFDRNVRSMQELQKELDYIHNNPVQRGLVPHPTDWAWSSARWWAGDKSSPVEIDHF